MIEIAAGYARNERLCLDDKAFRFIYASNAQSVPPRIRAKTSPDKPVSLITAADPFALRRP